MTAQTKKTTADATTSGIQIQDLPLEIIQSISKHFSAVKWARGPAQTCRLLSEIHLPHIAMDPVERLPYPDCLHASDDAKAKLTEKILAGLDWTAKRIGPATTSLNLEYQHLRDLPSSRTDNPLIAAFSDASRLSTLKCLRLVSFDRDHKAMAEFTDWLLEQLSSLKALYLLAPSTHLAAGTIILHQLRFLSLVAYSNVGSCLMLAETVPNLEILSIVGICDFKIETAGCKHLRLLNIDGTYHHDKPLEQSCRVSIDRLGEQYDKEPVSIQMASALRLAAHLAICCNNFFRSEASHGFFGGCPSLEVFSVFWVAKDTRQEQQPDALAFEHLLTRCMPAQGQPLWKLRSIIIGTQRPFYVRLKIPGKLPRLEELVVYTMGPLHLSFEDPIATSSSLKSFYAFGQSLVTNAVDVLRMSAALTKRGLTLSAVPAPRDCTGQRFSSISSCIYLRPIAAEDPPLRQLYALTERLALVCRCGACFTCLRRAGAVDACSSRPPDPAPT